MIKLKRVYDDVESDDGYRVLVERLWPRGMRKGQVKIDEWLKELGPSNELRKWFGHDPEKWEEFRIRYREELKGKGALLNKLWEKAREGNVTLLYSTRETEHNNAVALKELLDERMATFEK
jgi:uncharacterized protein YeaO (DUF488 family)